MARYQVILAYDGTQFSGFQRQPQERGARTVQSDVEVVLRQFGWQGQAILAAGRTDSGVHASGQVISFDLDWRHSPQALQAALNANLPLDLAVRQVKVVSPDFHPRYDALARRYRYRLFCRPSRDPLRERYSWRVWPAAEIEPMQWVAQRLVGAHDFAAFGAPPRPGGSTIRTVFEAGWQVDGFEWTFEILADAFLYHMVRRLVRFQVDIGQGKLPASRILDYLDHGPQKMVQGLAPPRGLALVEVIYPPESAG